MKDKTTLTPFCLSISQETKSMCHAAFLKEQPNMFVFRWGDSLLKWEETLWIPLDKKILAGNFRLARILRSQTVAAMMILGHSSDAMGMLHSNGSPFFLRTNKDVRTNIRGPGVIRLLTDPSIWKPIQCIFPCEVRLKIKYELVRRWRDGALKLKRERLIDDNK